LHTVRPLIAGQARRFDLLDPHSGEEIDEGLLLRFCAPRSYTGEDVVELSLHGNPILLEQAVQALQSAGARAAGPGEFTRRAVLNGKLNLLEAEAVAATIDAESRAAARLARRHLGGELGARVKSWKTQILIAAAALEALIDFPDEIEECEIASSLESLSQARRAMSSLSESYEAGRGLVRGWSVVITGPVNAGKSSLFNGLLDYERAITSAQEGTTRDVVSESVEWAGLRLRIEDTAGLRPTADPVELAGIARSGQAVARADLTLEVRDGRALGRDGDEHLPGRPAGATGSEGGMITPASASVPVLWIASHADCLSSSRAKELEEAGWWLIQPKSRPALDALRSGISAALHAGGTEDGLMIHTSRQQQALRSAAAHLAEAERHASDEPVLAALAIRSSADALEEFLGRWDREEVLDVLFERFCIGK
jgi:tRNA modification GTPase